MKVRTMIKKFLLPIILLLAMPAFADEPMLPPSLWETCSRSGAHCATLDPDANRITVRRTGEAGEVLWSADGWSRVAALADDGEHLVLGYEGMNLIPVDYDKDMAMLTFYRRGSVIAVVRLRDIAGWLNLRRTASHYYWGDYLGLDADGYYVVRVSRGGEIRFDMTTGQRVR
jgi:hypothetical protein